MSVFFMDFDMAPSVIWARDLYDQMQIRSDFRKWFPGCASMDLWRAGTMSSSPVSVRRMRAGARCSGM